MAQRVSSSLVLASRVADLYAALPQVQAVALGGSHAGGTSDAASDIDLYVYTREDIPLAARQAIVERSGGASKASLGLTFWGPSDEWLDASTGTEMDVIYFDTTWLACQIARVVHEHRASLGYTTCFWHIVRQSQLFHDPHGWFQRLQAECRLEYPELLRRNIIGLNHAVLRSVIPSYLNQLEKAVKREDLLTINRCLTALFASYFDIIFAVNRKPHPGEKRLIAIAHARCEKLPVDMAANIGSIMQASATDHQSLISEVAKLLDRLDQLLEQEGFDPGTSRPKELRGEVAGEVNGSTSPAV